MTDTAPVPGIDAAESPRGDHWRCIECREIVAVAELVDVVDGYAEYHVRAEHAPGCPGPDSVSAYCATHCPVPHQCGPALLVSTFECALCEDLIEMPTPLRVPATVGFHVHRGLSVDRVCGRLVAVSGAEGDTVTG